MEKAEPDHFTRAVAAGCVYSVISRLGTAPRAPVAEHQVSDGQSFLPRGSSTDVLPSGSGSRRTG